MTPAERQHVHRRVLEILMIAEPSRIDDAAIAIQAGNVRKARFRSREFARTTRNQAAPRRRQGAAACHLG